jgi:hypothetical protein
VELWRCAPKRGEGGARACQCCTVGMTRLPAAMLEAAGACKQQCWKPPHTLLRGRNPSVTFYTVVWAGQILKTRYTHQQAALREMERTVAEFAPVLADLVNISLATYVRRYCMLEYFYSRYSTAISRVPLPFLLLLCSLSSLQYNSLLYSLYYVLYYNRRERERRKRDELDDRPRAKNQ